MAGGWKQIGWSTHHGNHGKDQAEERPMHGTDDILEIYIYMIICIHIYIYMIYDIYGMVMNGWFINPWYDEIQILPINPSKTRVQSGLMCIHRLVVFIQDVRALVEEKMCCLGNQVGYRTYSNMNTWAFWWPLGTIIQGGFFPCKWNANGPNGSKIGTPINSKYGSCVCLRMCVSSVCLTLSLSRSTSNRNLRMVC